MWYRHVSATPPPFAPKPFKDMTRDEGLAQPREARVAFLAGLLADYTACDLGPGELDGIMWYAYKERQPPASDPPLHVFARIVTGAGCQPKPDAMRRSTPAP